MSNTLTTYGFNDTIAKVKTTKPAMCLEHQHY